MVFKMSFVFEGSVYSREAFIVNFVRIIVNLLCYLKVNLINIIKFKRIKNKSYVF